MGRNSRRASRKQQATAALGVFALGLGSNAGRAEANPFGYNQGMRTSDNALLTFNYQPSLLSNMRDATYYARLYAVNPTNINTVYVNTATTSTDVIVSQYAFPTSGWLSEKAGYWTCTRPSDFGECESGHVYYNSRYSYSDDRARNLACHEIGHALGMGHDKGATCMVDGSSGTRSYSSHNINDHINYWYPFFSG